MKPSKETLSSILAELWLILRQTFEPKPYIPQSNDLIYGTWTSPRQNPQKLVMFPDGTWKSFTDVNDTIPSNGGNFRVTRKWKDAEGNMCYYDDFTLQIDRKTCKAQELLKIHRGGKSGESIFRIVERFDNRNYPEVLDPRGPNYVVFFRAEEAQS